MGCFAWLAPPWERVTAWSGLDIFPRLPGCMRTLRKHRPGTAAALRRRIDA